MFQLALLLIGIQMSSSQAFYQLEHRLRMLPLAQFYFETTTTGSIRSHVRASVQLQFGNRLRLTGDGTFEGSDVKLSLLSTGSTLQGSNGSRGFRISTPHELTDSVWLGFTRMGLMHNIARLSSAAPPDHADKGAANWVTIKNISWGGQRRIAGILCRALTFDVRINQVKRADGILWIDESTGLPKEREQIVHFSRGDMFVTETYTFVTPRSL